MLSYMYATRVENSMWCTQCDAYTRLWWTVYSRIGRMDYSSVWNIIDVIGQDVKRIIDGEWDEIDVYRSLKQAIKHGFDFIGYDKLWEDRINRIKQIKTTLMSSDGKHCLDIKELITPGECAQKVSMLTIVHLCKYIDTITHTYCKNWI